MTCYFSTRTLTKINTTHENKSNLNKNGQKSCKKSVKLKNSETLKLLTTKFGKLQWVQFKSATDKIPVKNLWNLKTAVKHWNCKQPKIDNFNLWNLSHQHQKLSSLSVWMMVNFNYKISPPYYSSPSFLFKFVKS